MVAAGVEEGLQDHGMPFDDLRMAGGVMSEDVGTTAHTACAKVGVAARHSCALTHFRR